MEKLELDDTQELATGIYEIWSSSFAAEVKKDGNIIKRFSGETAWSDAERFVSDLRFSEMYQTH
jgi:hypothetical protein